METAPRSEHLVHFKTFELDLVTRELRRDGQRLKIHGHPIDILAILLERPGELVTRDEIRKRLWQKDTFVDFEQILNNSIGKLRDALGDRVEEPSFIETLPRLGYRFIAPVEDALDRRSASKTADIASATAREDAAFQRESISAVEPLPFSFARRFWIAAAVCAVVVLLATASFVYVRARRQATPHPSDSRSASALQIQPVTNAPGSAIFPVFSPDKREVAFLWDGPDRQHFDLYVLLLNSEKPLRLTENKSGLLGAPAWSPDGGEIAFSRCDGKNDGVYVVPALGGTERRLTTVGCPDTNPGPLAWLSDGKGLLMIDHCPGAGMLDLVVFSLISGNRRCLTHSGPGKEFNFVFQFSLSPDENTVAFIAAAAAPCFGDIYTIPLSGGLPHSMTVGGRCFGNLSRNSADLMWTPDSKSIVFVSRLSTLPSLWRVSANGGPVQREASYPAIGSFSKDGQRLVYSEPTVADGPTIWRADLASAGGPVLRTRELIKTQFAEMAPQVTQDGTRIVWRSDRTGYGQIWTSGADGGHPFQLTHQNWYSGVPRWSPDGKWIAFNQVVGNERQIFIINSQGSGLRQITDGPYPNAESSWSQDGGTVYFTSMRTGSWQVWKHSLNDGTEVQLTKDGGYDSFESFDGRTLYFSKFHEAGLWSVPVDGGAESLVVADKPPIGFWGYWGITKHGLYLLNAEADRGPRIEFYSFASRRVTPVLTIPKKPWPMQSSLSATGDGRTIYYTVYDQQSVIKMMEGSR